MNKRAWSRGERKRHVVCSFCGELHRRRSKEARQCRERHRHGKKPPPAPVERPARQAATAGSEATRYLSDPLRGDKQAHAIAKKVRAGMPARKIAKHLGLSVAYVEDVIAKL